MNIIDSKASRLHFLKTFCKTYIKKFWDNPTCLLLMKLCVSSFFVYKVTIYHVINWKLQEAQMMLTNLCNVFRGQSRSPNTVPFHMLGIVSYYAVVTLSLSRTVFLIVDLKNVMTLKSGSEVTQGH